MISIKLKALKTYGYLHIPTSFKDLLNIGFIITSHSNYLIAVYIALFGFILDIKTYKK